MSADPADLLNEGLKGTYVLERPIGEGGMATVYLARDLKHQRPVALKVLKPELAQSLGPDRFRREITTAARLQHPHILSVHDSGETQGQFWFTMPFVDGESLRERLKRERCLPIDDALRITREAAHALQYAHEHGIIHRDIKPENLLLTRDGFTLVADFGIARALGGDGTGTNTTGESLTQTGTSIGTPTYMAPEQATGEKTIDARADQYSLAATLYEMLAGEPPFTASTGAALIAKRFSSPTPSVREKRPDVSPLVDQALQQALSLRAHDRFATIQEFSRAVTQTSATPSSASTAALPAIPSPSGSVPAVAAPKRVSPALVALGLLAVVAVGALLLRRGSTVSPPAPAAAPVAAGPTRLVVLPFENLGDSADAYFAEGIADELRGKLTSVPGLEVIARASSVQYKGSGKSQAEIAKELGVRYLLTGTVRWEKSGGGKGRVRVSPELIEVSPNGAPASKWQQPFDAPITDVFQVQGDIAGKVAGALDVALGAGEQQKLAAQPTQNLAAYQAFLQGEATSQSMSENAGPAMRSSLGFYRQAAALDSGFALAWARISRVHSNLYFNGEPTPEHRTQAEAAAKRALAAGPDEPETHHSMGLFYQLVLAEPFRAKTELDHALRLDPRNAEVLSSLAQVEQSLGNWESALGHLQQASRIDPRSRVTARRVAQALLWTRRHDEALAASDRALSLTPGGASVVEGKAMVYLAKGDLAGAQAVMKASAANVTQAQMIYYFANFWDLFWALDESQQQALLAMRPADFDDNRAAWAMVQTQVRHLRGDDAGARAYADTARAEYALQVKAAPQDAQSYMLEALSLAYLGRGPEAVRLAEHGMTVEKNDVGYSLPYYRLLYIRTLILTGENARAVEQIRELLAKPFYVSRDWLRIDPAFDPLRKDPAFQQLLTGN